MIRPLVLSLALLALPTAAQEPRPDDRARLDQLDTAIGRALRQVLAEGSEADLAAATAALRGAALPAEQVTVEALAGDWQCRMTKIGGILPLVEYPPFRCRIELRDGVLHFDKLTGSQRSSGTLQILDGAWVYLGSTFVQGEAPLPYRDFPAELDTSAGETLPDAGLLEITGPGRARLLLPLPYRESLLNVLTLTRQPRS